MSHRMSGWARRPALWDSSGWAGWTRPAGRKSVGGSAVDLRALAGPPRAKARLDLARLYLADALGPEARTALELIDEADLGTVAAKPLRASRTALSGAAEALSGRPDTALANLLDHALDEDAEIALWRAYAAARASRWQLAAQEWHRSAGVPEGYPDPLRRRLGLELAAGLLDHGDAVEARALLAQLDGIELTGEDGARLRLLQGIAHSHEGRLREAAAAFALARDGSDGDIAARAEFLLASAQVELGELAPQAAVHLLKASRPGWRGHPWEARMLTRLAELQEMTEHPAAAIATRVEAIARTADPHAAEVGAWRAAQEAGGAAGRIQLAAAGPLGPASGAWRSARRGRRRTPTARAPGRRGGRGRAHRDGSSAPRTRRTGHGRHRPGYWRWPRAATPMGPCGA